MFFLTSKIRFTLFLIADILLNVPILLALQSTPVPLASLSTIRDVIYQADGKPFTGTVSIIPEHFDDANPPTLVAQVDDGLFSLKILPTSAGAVNSSYAVTFQSTVDSSHWTETWLVPLSDHLALKDVRATSNNDHAQRALSTPVPISDVSGLGAALNQIDTTLSSATTTENQLVAKLTLIQQTQAVFGEIPTGTINGTNAVFNLAHIPVSNTLSLWNRGLRLRAGKDYNLSGSSITFTTNSIPQVVGTLSADYLFSTSSPSVTGGTSAVRTTGQTPIPINDVVGLAADLSQINTQLQSLNSGLTTVSAALTVYLSTLWIIGEIPGGALNGSNVTFSLANVPVPATSVRVYRNGLRLSVGMDYSISGASITFLSTAIPQLSDLLQVDYTAQ
jgi:hypothetical protein